MGVLLDAPLVITLVQQSNTMLTVLKKLDYRICTQAPELLLKLECGAMFLHPSATKTDSFV